MSKYCQGLLSVLIKTAVDKEDRPSEINFSEQQLNDITDVYAHACVSLIAQAGKSVPWDIYACQTGRR